MPIKGVIINGASFEKAKKYTSAYISINNFTDIILYSILLMLTFHSAHAQNVKYIHTDGLGSVSVVTGADRSLLSRQEYEPYGLFISAQVEGMGYAGHVNDTSTGFTYMQQRYYDPIISRFLSVDPVGTNEFSGLNFNRYWYADGNPFTFTDPDGRQVAGRPADFAHPVTVEQSAQLIGWTADGLDAVDLMLAPFPAGQLEHAAIGPMVAGMRGLAFQARAAATTARTVSIEAKAAKLAARAGSNSVTIRTAGGQIRYDLQGAEHFSKQAQKYIQTPHVVTYKNNVIQNGPRAGQVGSITQVGDTVPATRQDLKAVEKVLDDRGK